MNRSDSRVTPPAARIARRRGFPALRLCLAALALLPLAALAGQSDAPALLRMKFRQGEVNKYQTNMQMTMHMVMNMGTGQSHPGPAPQPMTIPVNMNMLIQQQVTKVLANGNGVITSTVLNQQMSMNGQTRPNGANTPTTTITMTPLGKVVSMTGIPQQNPMSGIFGPNSLSGMGTYLPSRAVRPGDSWTDTMRMPGLTGAGSGTVRSHFIRYETVGRYRTALIRSVVTVPLNMNMNMMGQPAGRSGAGTMTMSGSMHITTDNNFAVAEGKLIRTTGDGGASIAMHFPHSSQPSRPGMGAMPQSTLMTMKMTMTMTLTP
ncbi:MAG TPA: hypothetical protein VKT32_05490 [Chthonomonadaceae bacterium]|nr:hypothetical protein [Chthonomonadaceae bacterium]